MTAVIRLIALLVVPCQFLVVAPNCVAGRSAGSSQTQSPPPRGPERPGGAGGGWQAAVFRGLKVGESKRADMLRLLGNPRETVPAEADSDSDAANPEAWYYYENADSLGGDFIVGVNKSDEVVKRVILRPASLARDAATKHFGPDYVVTTYAADECLSAGDAVPLYESPTGTIKYIEYRDRGIAISTNHRGMVEEILYLGEPVGAKESKCQN